MGAHAPPPIIRPPSDGLRSTLSVLWLLALITFFVFIALNFVGLILSPAYIVPGIEGIAPGQNVNQDLAAGSANWTFQPLGTPGAAGTYNGSGGNPDGYLQMTLPSGTNSGGEWVQMVQLTGSAPWAAEVHLDYLLPASSFVPGRIVVAVETTSSGIDVGHAAAVLWVNASTAWTSTPAFDLSGSINESGTYYLKVAYLAASNGRSTVVGFDNVHMGWTTDAGFYFYLPLPLPVLLLVSQAKAPFLAYYVFIALAILASGAWYAWRDRKLTMQAFTAPLRAIGTRLRSMSGWVAVAQVWLATTFFQYALILALAAAGAPPSSPFTPTTTNAWVLLFDYSAASVFEEIAFRAFVIGVPLVLAALILRWAAPRNAPASGRPGAPRKNVLGELRYLWGGQLRRESPRGVQLLAWILIFVSAFLFGLAHAPGWGWWKVLPAFVVGLGMGYLFVRHGLGAAILLHFATDGSLALSLEGVGGVGLSLVSDLLFLGLAIAGSGFFAWYVLYGWEEFRALRARFGSRLVRQPIGAGPGPGMPPPSWAYPPSAPYPVQPYSTVPSPGPLPGGGPPTAQGWPSPPGTIPTPRNPNQLPHGYAPTYHPAPYGYPPVRFQCPYCGWVEAKYEGRRFTCLRCGRTA
jgi:membrane protease YdiL (CAAX protease family)